MELEEGSSPSGLSKKHKKHKKKHKHRRESNEPADHAVSSPKTSIKLKLKIGGETMATKKETDATDVSVTEKSQKKEDSDEISDEEQWLDALEKGTLDNLDLSKKDPSLLTTRQRALLHGGQQDELLQLPSGYKTVELTDEQKKRRQEKAKRRRQQASEKIENDKNETVNKLLKKQEAKMRKTTKPRGGKRNNNTPRALYRSASDGISVSFPVDVPFPMTAQTAGDYPVRETCGVGDCDRPKTSVCSRSHVPVCGLACYKKNLQLWNTTQETARLEVT